MTTKEKLEELVKSGSLLAVADQYFHPARVQLDDGVLIWVNVFPDSQHDVHRVEFASIEVFADRDVVMRDKKGKIVAQVSPFAEWEGVPELEVAKDEHNRWLSSMKDKLTRELFNDFADQEIRMMGE